MARSNIERIKGLTDDALQSRGQVIERVNKRKIARKLGADAALLRDAILSDRGDSKTFAS
jgi:hypothetical protein